ncbi:hypothetical protein BH10PLA2_BH10PLA2_30260 [soil metagenome]
MSNLLSPQVKVARMSLLKEGKIVHYQGIHQAIVIAQ